jgi:hypothetical protein
VVLNHLGEILYVDFLDRTFPLLLKDVPSNVHEGMWFQHDCPSPFSHQVSIWLDSHFQNTWIGCEGSIVWLPHSPSLKPLDFFLWECFKENVHAVEV